MLACVTARADEPSAAQLEPQQCTQPAVAAFASSTEEVCCRGGRGSVAGSMHSVNACLSNSGTILILAGAWAAAAAGRDTTWCVAPRLATQPCVGSLGGRTPKDSSIAGPGYLSALVSEVKYVDEVMRGWRSAGNAAPTARTVCAQRLADCMGSTDMMLLVAPQSGHVITLSRAKTPAELLAFTGSYGERLCNEQQH